MRLNSPRPRPAAAPLEAELAGLDTLAMPLVPRRSRLSRTWDSAWPKLAAIAFVLVGWQLVTMSGFRPSYILPGPIPVLERLGSDLLDSNLPLAIAITMRRAFVGFGLAILVGVLIGLAVVRSRSLRSAIGSLITGLQTMPSIAWFPLAILIFGLTETSILFVVVLGAAPAIANGLISGVDQIPRILLRAGYVLGARRFAKYRHVIMPAALPSFVAGTKQGWAFAWRSLLAGELLVIIAAQPSIGVKLQFAREFSDARGLLATMVVILVIGIVIDAIFFSTIDRAVRRRWGLLGGR